MSTFENIRDMMARQMVEQFGDKQFGDFPSHPPRELSIVGNIVRLRGKSGLWQVVNTIGLEDGSGIMDARVRLQSLDGGPFSDEVVSPYELRAVSPLEVLGEQAES